jgi:hypothetical protein
MPVWRKPVIAIKPTANAATLGAPPITTTAEPSTTVWTINETNVAVAALEWLRPRLTETLAAA